MKLEQQVTSLELSKRLKELGVKQESYFYHWNTGIDFEIISRIGLAIVGDKEIPENYSAFTVAELGEFLPFRFSHGERNCYLECTKTSDNQWNIIYRYRMREGMVQECGTTATTEADAHAKMLIYLLENNLLANPSSL